MAMDYHHTVRAVSADLAQPDADIEVAHSAWQLAVLASRIDSPDPRWEQLVMAALAVPDSVFHQTATVVAVEPPDIDDPTLRNDLANLLRQLAAWFTNAAGDDARDLAGRLELSSAATSMHAAARVLA